MTPDGGSVQPSKMKPFFTLKYKNGDKMAILVTLRPYWIVVHVSFAVFDHGLPST